MCQQARYTPSVGDVICWLSGDRYSTQKKYGIIYNITKPSQRCDVMDIYNNHIGFTHIPCPTGMNIREFVESVQRHEKESQKQHNTAQHGSLGELT